MFESKFSGVAEVEAYRAGYNPAGVSSPFHYPRLIAAGRRAVEPHTVTIGVVDNDASEAAIRAEMERRLAERSQLRRLRSA